MGSGEHRSLDTGPEMTCQRIDLDFSAFGKGSKFLVLDLKSGEHRIAKCPALIRRPAEAVLMRGTHDGLVPGDRDRNHVIPHPLANFHPKLYLLSSPLRTELLVASANLTPSGFESNPEIVDRLVISAGERDNALEMPLSSVAIVPGSTTRTDLYAAALRLAAERVIQCPQCERCDYRRGHANQESHTSGTAA
jgi:hypothetical protein